MSGTIYGDDALNLLEAAEYCDYSMNTFNQRCKSWGLPPTQIGGRNYWFKDDLDKFKAGRIPEKYGAGIRWRLPRQGEVR